MNIKQNILLRAYITFFIFLLFGVLIFGQIIKIHQVEGDRWRQEEAKRNMRYDTIYAVRGNILADDGSLISASLPMYDIRLDLNTEAITDKIFDQEIDSLALKLSTFFKDKSPFQYKKTLVEARERGSRYFLLKRNISHTELQTLRTFPIFEKGRYKGGFIAEKKSKRIKPFQVLAARTIGYSVGETGVGLEGTFNDYLAGTDGKRLMQKIGAGNWMPVNDENQIEPQAGVDLISTINMNMQDITENALLKVLQEHDAAYGCAVVMEVETGHIKAIANLGKNKDDEASSPATYSERYNYAVGASTEPGSTFKLVSSLILLEKGLLKPDDLIDTKEGEVDFYDRTMRDAKEGGYGKITFQQAFELSSNVAFSKVINQFFADNPQRFIDEVKKLQIHEPLGITIKGEGKPYIKSPKNKDWSGITLPWMSIGYEVQMTPLQVLTLYNAIANNGKMVKPQFIKEARSIGRVNKVFETETINPKVCSPGTIETLKEMMEGVVNNGTAMNIKSDDYSIAGKTGTAQVAYSGSYQTKRTYQASFAGFFPSENPKYSCIVVINDPKRGIYYGSWVAGPVFREISDKVYASALDIHPPYQHQDSLLYFSESGPKYIEDLENFAQALSIPLNYGDKAQPEWVATNVDKHQLQVQPHHFDKERIPDVRGMCLSDAIYLLENRGLSVKTRGFGEVVTQSIPPGSPQTEERIITLQLAEK